MILSRFFVPDLRSETLTQPTWRQHRWPQIVVFTLATIFALWFSWFTIQRAQNFNAGWYDLGIMAQTVWRTSHGFGFTFTNPELGPGGAHGWTAPRTSIHTDYFLILLAPLSWFGNTVAGLLIIQAAVVALGAWFAWRIATRLIGRPWLAVIVAGLFLSAPPLEFAAMFEFHSVTLAITFILAAVDALLARRNRAFWMWAGLALITKENTGITLGLISWLVLWWQSRRKLAWWALGVCWAWVIIQIGAVIPLSRQHVSASFTNKFYGGGEGQSGLAFLKRLFNPSLAWHKLATAVHLNSGFQLLLPGGLLLALLSPMILLAIPELLLYWLSDSPNQQTVVLHYHALVIPVVFLASMFAWRCFRTVGFGRGRGKNLVDGVWIGALVLSTSWAAVRLGPLPGAGQTRWPLVAWKEHLAPNVTEALNIIPARASVATTQNLGPALAERPTVYLLPSGVKQADYIVVLERQFPADLKTSDKRLAEKIMLERLQDWLASSSAYTKRYQVDRVWVWQRIGDEPRPLPAWPDHLLGQ